MSYHHRITWIDGVPHLQRCPRRVLIESSPFRHHERNGTYAADGEIVRRATADDLRDMADGRISYDPETDPGGLAWAAHVAAGGD